MPSAEPAPQTSPLDEEDQEQTRQIILGELQDRLDQQMALDDALDAKADLAIAALAFLITGAGFLADDTTFNRNFYRTTEGWYSLIFLGFTLFALSQWARASHISLDLALREIDWLLRDGLQLDPIKLSNELIEQHEAEYRLNRRALNSKLALLKRLWYAIAVLMLLLLFGVLVF